MRDLDARIARLSPDQRELYQRWLTEVDDSHPTAGADGPAPPAPPRTSPEQVLVDVVGDVLDQRGAVGIDDDYFELGGDSISAIVVIAKAQAAGVGLTTHDLFTLRTIRRIAAEIAADQLSTTPRSTTPRSTTPRSATPPSATPPPFAHPPPAPEAGAPGAPIRLPLTPMQQSMLYHTLADPAGTAYVVQASALLHGEIDPEAIASAWRETVARHPALRISVHWTGDQPEQLVHPSVQAPFESRDLRRQTAGERDAAVAAYLREDLAAGFDLARPPLLRLALLRLSDATCRLVLTHHHVLLDGWSQQLIIRDFLACYDAAGAEVGAEVGAEAGAEVAGTAGAEVAGTAAGGIDLLCQFLHRVNGQDAAAATAYWKRRLAGFVPIPTVPIPTLSAAGTGPSPHPTSPAAARAEAVARYGTRAGALPTAVADALHRRGRRLGVTVSTLLCGGWAILLAGLTGTRDVAFGVTVSGRSSELDDPAGAVGMFINTLPFRVAVEAQAPLSAWLRGLQRQQGELTRFQHTPLTEVARCVAASPRRALFDTLVVVENFPMHVAEGTTTRRLRVTDLVSHVEEGYPLVLEAHPGPPFRLRLRYDTAAVDADLAQDLLAALESYLRNLAAAPDPLDRVRLRDIAVAVRGARRAPPLAGARRHRIVGARDG